MLDNVALYRRPTPAGSSAPLYYEGFGTDFPTQRLALPVAVRVFPGEVFQPPRLWGERVYSRLFYWNESAHGGHFAAFEQPAVFVQELPAPLPQHLCGLELMSCQRGLPDTIATTIKRA